MTHDLTVVVLAAGGGTRMRSKTMKVLHPVGGRSMIGHVLAAAEAMEPDQVVAVVGHQREQVSVHIRELYPDIRIKLFYARDFRALMVKYGRMSFLSEIAVTNGAPNGARTLHGDPAPAVEGAA